MTSLRSFAWFPLLAFVSLFSAESSAAEPLRAVLDESEGKISVYRVGGQEPILVQQASPEMRPYIHPIIAPDGKGVLTEFRPNHHLHQTGLYWGFTRINGRDYFHHPEDGYWKKVSAKVTQSEGTIAGPQVAWETVYDLLDAENQPVLRETLSWTMREIAEGFQIDVKWSGLANQHVTIGKYDYGGLFLRMPWRDGINGQVFNAARQKNERGEGQRAVWVDVGMQLEGRDDQAHIAIFDHPSNPGFPQAWRVDGQLGVGPVPSREQDLKIEKDKTLELRHRLLVYTGELDDVEMTEHWSEYSGQQYAWHQWQVAQREGRNAKFLTPQAAVENMTLQDGFQANVYAAEPMVTQPMAFCWDDRGRMWIAENRDYEDRQKGFANSGDSRIIILEDTDRDGVADSRKVFAEGIPFPAAIAVGFNGLWLGAPPNLLFLPDEDGDDRADMDDVQVRLTGWGIRDRHETLNSFHWGPDGWLYGCQGYATPSQVGKPKGKGKLYRHQDPFPESFDFEGEPVDINGGVWRYHPTKDRFEVVAHGFSNPWGLDYDAKGQLFISACVIPHLWHVIPGGIYHRQGGSHFNPHVYSDIRTIADHRHRSAHGGARIYLSDALPEKYHGRIFMANIHEHAVLTDILRPAGSGFVGVHGDDFLLANNAQWIGFSMEIGPEGCVYVLDWHDADICGKEVLNKETGRVFRVVPEQSAANDWKGRYDDLNTLDDVALAELQLSPSAWHARRARLILQSRAAQRALSEECVTALNRIFHEDENSDWRLRAMWALHVIDRLHDSTLMQSLDDYDPHVRAWAIQLLCEDMRPSSDAASQFATMAQSDPSPVVRLYLASALQRMTSAQAWSIVEALVMHSEDETDHNLPKMIWFGLEPLVEQDPKRAVALATNSQLSMITRHVARRMADGDRLEELLDGLQVTHASTQQMLLGLRDALEGMNDVTPPSNWADVYAKLQAQSGPEARIGLELAQKFGDSAANDRMMKTLQDESAGDAARLQALQALASQRNEQLAALLPQLLEDPQFRLEAIRASTIVDDESVGKLLLNMYPDQTEELKAEIVQAMATRSGYGRLLTDAIESGEVPRRDIPAYTARTLRRVVGNGFVEVWGAIDGLDADEQAAFAKYRALLSENALDSADPSRGRAVFNRTCVACHKLYGEGGMVGPDITGANRGNIEYLLGNILTPSAEIQDAYKMHLVLTDDGRVYSGIPAGESDRQLRLRVANRDEPVVIAKSEIESREIAPVSMMPSGMLKTLSDREVLDLIAYLRLQRQVPLPGNASE